MTKSKSKAHASPTVPPKVEEPRGDDAIVESAPAESAEIEAGVDDTLNQSEEEKKVEKAEVVNQGYITNNILNQYGGEDEEKEIADDLDDSEEGDTEGDQDSVKSDEEDDLDNDDDEQVEVKEGEGNKIDEEERRKEDEDGNEKDYEETQEDENQVEVQVEEGDNRVDEETQRSAKIESLEFNAVPQSEKVEGDEIKEHEDSEKKEGVPTMGKRRMKKSKKAATGVTNDEGGAGTATLKKGDGKKAESMGLIFMCNKKTKNDCFQYKIFGLPEGKKALVENVYKGMKLFLFDIDLKLMYGIYKAASPGGYNIEPKAFKSAFPSQVRFEVLNDCLPLPEEKFKEAIKDNYYGRNKFDCKLSAQQVINLCKLFRNATKASKRMMSRELQVAKPETTSSARARKRPRKVQSTGPAPAPAPISSARTPRRSREVQRAELAPTSSARGPKRPRAVQKAEPASTLSAHARKRSRRNEPAAYSRNRNRSHRDEPTVISSRDRNRSRRHENERQERRVLIVPRGRDLHPPRRREAYDSPPPRPLPVPPPPVPYSYDRPAEDHYYRTDPRPLEPRDHRVMGLALRPHEPRDHRVMSLESRPHELLDYRNPYGDQLPYREPFYPPSVYAPPPPSVYAPPHPTAVASLPSSFAPPSSAAANLPYSYAPHLYYRY